MAKKYCEEIFCAGFGGQGIMFMGKLLAQAGLAAGKNVTWMPSYGAEVRGGAAYSMAKISDQEIASPIVTEPTVLIVMNRPSLLKYADKLKEGSTLIINTSLIDKAEKIKGVKMFKVPMSGIASKIGDIRCANMVAIGALLKVTKTLSLRNVANALKDMLKNNEKLFALNKEALEKGYKAV
jgi:2-oxoglutarate ferredoxin oxidoreductase subunit gamma